MRLCPEELSTTGKLPKGFPLPNSTKKFYISNHGCLVPKRELIKTPEQIEGIRRSGIVNTGVLDLVEKEIRAGMSTAEIDRLVYDYTVCHGQFRSAQLRRFSQKRVYFDQLKWYATEYPAKMKF